MAGDQSVWAEGEVDSSGAERGQLGLEEGVGIGEEVGWPKAGETVEYDIGGCVEARSGEGEDVGLWGVGVEGETEQEEEDDAAEEDVQGPAGGGGERSGGRSTGDRDAQTPVGGDQAWEEDWTEEDEEGLDAIRGLDMGETMRRWCTYVPQEIAIAIFAARFSSSTSFGRDISATQCWMLSWRVGSVKVSSSALYSRWVFVCRTSTLQLV